MLESPIFNSYKELNDWYDESHRCVVCGASAYNGKVACKTHADAWSLYAKRWRDQGAHRYEEYTRWVNEEKRKLYTMCASCEQPCPSDDYLCEQCRE